MQLSRAMSNPREHMVAAKRVFRYIKRMPNLCVRYSKDFILHGYSDASHSDDPNNSRSILAYLCMFAGGPATWSPKKQPVVALSSCESEYIALSYASQEAVYTSDLFSALTLPRSFFCADVRGQHGSSPAMSYYSTLVKDLTHLYEIPFSARAGCIEQDNHLSCHDNRSAGGHLPNSRTTQV